MRKNPQIIRPKPEDVTTVWNEVRRCAREVYEEVLDLPFRKLQPMVKSMERPVGSRRVRRIGLEWSLGDKIRFVPRGGEFDLYFGPELSANKVVSMAKQAFNNKYGPRYDPAMVEDVSSCVFTMARSAPISQVADLLKSKEFSFDTHDYIGNPITVDFEYDISRKATRFHGAHGSPVGPDDNDHIISLGIGRSWSIEEFASFSKFEDCRLVIAHELTHAIDPGISKERYRGTPEEILGYPIEAAVHAADEMERLGHHEEARRARLEIEDAHVEYRSGTHEVRAEAGAYLSFAIQYAVFFRSKNKRNMRQADLIRFINKYAVMYADMNERAQTKFFRYIADALREQGLMDLLVQEELFPQRLDADLALVLVQLDGPRGTEPDDGDALRQDLLDHVADPSAADDPGTFAYLRHQYTSVFRPTLSRAFLKKRTCLNWSNLSWSLKCRDLK